MSYKYISNTDRVVSTTNLYESVSSNSGNVLSFNTASFPYFAAVYSASNATTTQKIFDVSFGRSAITTETTADASLLAKKKLVYNEFAKLLLGVNSGSVINKFSLATGSNVSDPPQILNNAFFITFPRSNFKDKIKPGTFELVLNATATRPDSGNTRKIKLSDLSGTMTVPFKKTCETGEYGVLLASPTPTSVGGDFIIDDTNRAQGLIFYEAGVAVVSPYIFSEYNASNVNPSTINTYLHSNKLGIIGASVAGVTASLFGASTIADLITGSTIPQAGFGLASVLHTASYQSTTELNSTIYFCRAFNDEFNYSSNPTYLTASEILVKGGDPMAQPVSYITTVGLYDDKNQLLAVAKVSEPIKKTPDTELIARVRLDF